MAKAALHTSDVAIDQLDPIIEGKTAKPEIVEADASILRHKEYQELLAMGEDPIRIIINAAAVDNPPMSYSVEVNGTGAEVWANDQWIAIKHIPVETEVVVKRKYVESLMRAKTMVIRTKHDNAMVENPRNETIRKTSAVANVQILHDPNPRGLAWQRDLLRRNF